MSISITIDHVSFNQVFMNKIFLLMILLHEF